MGRMTTHIWWKIKNVWNHQLDYQRGTSVISHFSPSLRPPEPPTSLSMSSPTPGRKAPDPAPWTSQEKIEVMAQAANHGHSAMMLKFGTWRHRSVDVRVGGGWIISIYTYIYICLESVYIYIVIVHNIAIVCGIHLQGSGYINTWV